MPTNDCIYNSVAVVGWLIRASVVLILASSLAGVVLILYVFAETAISDHLQWSTRVLVFGLGAYKMLLTFFLTCGGLTLVSTAHSGLDLTAFWNYKGWRGLCIFKNWQAQGFILRPFGLFVVGGMLFITQNLVTERIVRGDGFNRLRPSRVGYHCYFERQATLVEAHVNGDIQGKYNKDTFWKSFFHPECGFFDVECRAEVLGVKVYSKEASVLQWLCQVLNWLVRRFPPSSCVGADDNFNFAFLTIPKKDIPAENITGEDSEYAKAFYGTSFLPWDRNMYYADELKTACHYTCVKPKLITPADFVMSCGIIIGGGLSVVLGANEFGKRFGAPSITPDTTPDELSQAILADVRILLPILWTEHIHVFSKPYGLQVFYRVSILVVKCIIAWIGVGLYGPYLKTYTYTYADTCIMHCVFWLGIWVTIMRSCFVYTENIWSQGQETNFIVKKPEGGMALTTIDLYSWLRLSRKQLVERLIFYIRGIGQDELNSDKPLRVAAITEMKSKDWDESKTTTIPELAKGTIEKYESGGARFENKQVLVHFDDVGWQAVDAGLLMQIEGQFNTLDDVKALASIGITPFEIVDKAYKRVQPMTLDPNDPLWLDPANRRGLTGQNADS